MPRLVNRTPRYTLHSASGQAVVKIAGQSIYLGKYGSRASRDAYDRTIGEWLARGRCLPTTSGLTVSELLNAFRQHAEAYYVGRDGKPSREYGNFRDVMKPLRRLYGATPADQFGPLALQSLMGEFVTLDWCRNVINRRTTRIKQIFGWAVSQELIPASVHEALLRVKGLRKGKTAARETEPVMPARTAMITAVLPLVSRQVRAMIELQLYTGMRPGEVCEMTTGALDRSGNVWI
jgi:integrase